MNYSYFQHTLEGRYSNPHFPYIFRLYYDHDFKRYEIRNHFCTLFWAKTKATAIQAIKDYHKFDYAGEHLD